MAGDRTGGLAALRAQVMRLERGAGGGAAAGARPAALPFGVAALDARLPGGGLRLGALHEVAPAGPELAHAAARTLFAAGVLARMNGPVLWCPAAHAPFAPALARAGLHPDRVIYARTHREAEMLPLVEEGARFPGLAAVVGEVARMDLTATRRLQLAAEASGVTVLLLRRVGLDRAAAGTASAATTGWRVAAAPSPPLASPPLAAPPLAAPALAPLAATPGLGRARWRVALTRCRGAPAGTPDCDWTLEACDEAGRLALAADLAHRQDPAARPRRAAAR